MISSIDGRRELGGLSSVVWQAMVIGTASFIAYVAWTQGQRNSLGGPSMFGAILVMAALFIVAIILGSLRRIPKGITTEDAGSLLLPYSLGVVLGLLAQQLLPPTDRASVNFAVSAGVLAFVGQVVLRLGLNVRRRTFRARSGHPRALIVGSGDAAAAFVRLTDENPYFKYDVVCCVDDRPLADRIAGRPVLAKMDELATIVRSLKIQTIIVAIPAAPASLIRKVTAAAASCDGSGAERPSVKVLPGLLELLNDDSKISRIRNVKPEDLLPRDPVKVDLSLIAPHVQNKVILVTGAGGSIGSELCRQIVALKPERLLLLGHGENSLFAIDEELRQSYGFKGTRIILADVADAARIRSVFSEFRPHVVFHAAAHKHVPIVESNVCEAVRNNVLGTHVVSLAAAAAGVAKFVLLSTDKAVNPSSIMGVTKRLSEIISQSFVNQTGTEFVTVRFGNVLGSRGSVIPVFKRQIENGGPVTITHRDMQRYFMTIPEAVSLVLQAMALGRDGQVLVLDMGKPVNILTLAETLIELSGFVPYRDVAIVETGIRPGEKLFEEILTTHEGLSTTSHERLFIAQQERIVYETLAVGLKTLEMAVKTGDVRAILDVIITLVPSFQPGAHLGEPTAPNAEENLVAATNGHTHQPEITAAADSNTAKQTSRNDSHKVPVHLGRQ